MRTIIITLASAFLLTSCYHEPEANFHVSNANIEPFEDIWFTNTSYHADYFEWDFGDGYFSNAFNARHSYESPGVYTVTLTAFHDNHEYDRAYTTIRVYGPTSLVIEILEYYDEYPVQDASVILYSSLYDWDNEYHPLVEGFTNKYGEVTFTNLNSQRYYVDVWEENHNNYILADEDVSFIETLPLEQGSVNYFTAWVDYVVEVKKDRQDSKTEAKKKLKIMKIERSYSDKSK